MKKVLSFLFSFFILLSIRAQEANEVEMADVMRSNGKIYVVLTVVLVIFSGIIFFLIKTDNKVSRLEKELKNKQ
jgi:hypothetical protein